MSPVHWSKGVSRSFYLSLRLLPAPMRDAAALGYLLARTSDTLADSATLPAADRLEALREFGQAVTGHAAPPVWPTALPAAIADVRERELLTRSGDLIAMLRALPPATADLVREVVTTIIGGQQLDLTRFADATAARPIALPDAAALDDYAWRVAGCVGEFWTRLGATTLGSAFSTATTATLLPQAAAYGMGLQLVNILRDLPADLAAGRCYLPVGDPGDRAALLACHARWIEIAAGRVAEGDQYAATLRSRRLRAASRLPALLAGATLDRLRGSTWETLQTRVKVPRRRVYQLLWRAWWA